MKLKSSEMDMPFKFYKSKSQEMGITCKFTANTSVT